ncbi:MAG TPA: transglycosylase SLT domain-containing protein [Smithellaceae bacterium]|nr:transglycosylase SLT domain-containing protein [Smithellaceae bacterium]
MERSEYQTGAVLVTVKHGLTVDRELRFEKTFAIGRGGENDIQFKDACVSRNHLTIVFDGADWQLHDVGSSNGTFINGERIGSITLDEPVDVELGKNGPVISFVVEKIKIPIPEPKPVSEPVSEPLSGAAAKDVPFSETQIIRHYFSKSSTEAAGEHTIMIRRAFEKAHKKKSRKYWVIIGVTLLVLATAAGVIVYQTNKIKTFKHTAQNIFYDTKSLELQISKLEEAMASAAGNTYQAGELQAKRRKLREMEKNYDTFVRELGTYNKLTEEEKVIYRMARVFGECDINIPADFTKEVMSYINKWKSTNRLRDGLERAQTNGYTPTIVKALNENNLPPQYFFLALQESGFNERAIGPMTRFGYAKGMWQFIAMTADTYNLKVGPLYAKPVYDPMDDRFDFQKATHAAARYLKFINNTEAQSSGLLVMASYNWGEERVINAIRKMPENPRDRNFWRLLAIKSIPAETYDYVFYIFSASVICENPKLFGFNGACPDFKKAY